jgi:hypothetical protein
LLLHFGHLGFALSYSAHVIVTENFFLQRKHLWSYVGMAPVPEFPFSHRRSTGIMCVTGR